MMDSPDLSDGYQTDHPCDTCGAKVVNTGESADPQYLVIACPVCGVAFLLLKSQIGILYSSHREKSHNSESSA